MTDETMEAEVAKAIEAIQPITNGGSTHTLHRKATLTEEIDRVIAACHHRIKLLEAIRATI